MPNNKVLACKRCNDLKKDMMPEDFMSDLQNILAENEVITDRLKTMIEKLP